MIMMRAIVISLTLGFAALSGAQPGEARLSDALLATASPNGRSADTLEALAAEVSAARRARPADAALARLADRCARFSLGAEEKIAVHNAVDLLVDLSSIEPLRPTAAALARAVDAYVTRFDADDLETWQPLFSFLWYQMRRPPEGLSESDRKDQIDRYAEFLETLASRSTTRALQAMASYVYIENRLVLEREFGVLPQDQRGQAVAIIETLRDRHGSLQKPKKNRLDWDRPYRYYAQGQLAEIGLLHVGAVAPEIAGEDLDGVSFRLSDYRGQVVLLSFWGAWCAPCVAAIPQENQLADRLRDKPFAIVGVNTDSDLDTARAALREHGVEWRSFWNGPTGWEGNIAYQWFVQGYPMYYVLDAEGRIRFKNRSYAGVEETIANLLSKRALTSPTRAPAQR